MSRAMYPILSVVADTNEHFPVKFADIFAAEGGTRDDEFTFTTRLEVSDVKARDRIRARLRAEDPASAERLIALLDENDWSVSVLVDPY